MFSEKTPPWNGLSLGPIIVACSAPRSRIEHEHRVHRGNDQQARVASGVGRLSLTPRQATRSGGVRHAHLPRLYTLSPATL
jgi:hypothetical protein